jgi:hypothetical protein
MISPWVAVYFGVTILTTVGTVWRFQEWAKRQDHDAEVAIYAQLDSDSGPKMFQHTGPDAV